MLLIPLVCLIVLLSIPHQLSCYIFVHFSIPSAQRSIWLIAGTQEIFVE